MRLALLADIHANRLALEACLDHARSQGADRLVFLGDYVGYGAQPAEVLDRIMAETARGALAVVGNHDRAVADVRDAMAPDAETAMAWTRGQLGPEARDFLASLPLRFEDGPRLYVHASPQTYPPWIYIREGRDARRALEASRAQTVFCGHTHIPALHGLTATGQLVSFQPVPSVPVPLPPHRRWLTVVGAVGQSRDGNPAAAYALLDTAASEITHFRVPYDVQAAAAAVLEAGLPPALAARLRKGL
ncbi:metallophosphoesterase family protein [Geothrix fermentans]|jgi:diadenosine tetraphosphatase ApaH/serine/threonine PP2A family protein phosphatase|uniref:metallophosphoesterase family protein n=1 Tax=Geothrix fermentans TaxID=44676 RepID=UPI00041D5E93|nr:metallophosphoesterase family protein [Geothrix fermentans]